MLHAVKDRAREKSEARAVFDRQVASGRFSPIDLRNESSIFSVLDLKHARLAGRKVIRLDAPVARL